jgi:hypothetical protein
MAAHHLLFGRIYVLERERHDRGGSIYQLKRRLSFKGRSITLPALGQLRSAA